MKLIIGLGNPGRKYQNTRHNTGHLFISAYGKQLTANGKAMRDKPKTVCCKTSVFMNESGSEVKSLITNYKLNRRGRLNAIDSRFPITNLLIVHDDMDLALGEFKMQLGRSSAGHKGVQSVIEELGTDDFWRLRFGIGRPPEGMPSEEFVLSEFYEEEKPKLEAAFEEALPQVRDWAREPDKSA